MGTLLHTGKGYSVAINSSRWNAMECSVGFFLWGRDRATQVLVGDEVAGWGRWHRKEIRYRSSISSAEYVGRSSAACVVSEVVDGDGDVGGRNRREGEERDRKKEGQKLN